MPFWDAQSHYSRLCSVQDERPELLEAIHEFCLDSLTNDNREDAIIEMKNEKLVDRDERINPQFRDVVLASLHGHGNSLTLISPFVTPVDQALYDLINSSLILRCEMGQEAADQLIAETLSHPLIDMSGTLSHVSKLRRKPLADEGMDLHD